MKLKELGGGLVQMMKASGSHPNDEDLLTVSRKGPNLSAAVQKCSKSESSSFTA